MIIAYMYNVRFIIQFDPGTCIALCISLPGYPTDFNLQNHENVDLITGISMQRWKFVAVCENQI